jgi:hypothetical protein
MATRALELRRALDWLFTAVEEPWYEAGAVISQQPELLSYKLTPREWSIVKTLQLVLKNFAIVNKVMQGDPSTPKNKGIGRFDNYLPNIELLLDHL